MKQKKLPKERNPFVVHALKRKAGVHEKTKKTIRRDEKMKLKKDYLEKFVA